MPDTPIIFYIQVSKVIDGRYRTFIEGTDGKAVSPILDSLADLYPWMRENGWVADEYDHEGKNFDPWRVSKKEDRRYKPRHSFH